MNHSLSTFTAIDIGSNSFRFLVAHLTQTSAGIHFKTLETGRESVRLAAGLNAENELDHFTYQRGLLILKRFGERLKNIPCDTTRAVATSTLRIARNAPDFLFEAEHALGHPITVISEEEEARLIYLGASYEALPCAQNRLVIDIGGGSTELVIGQGHQAILLKSLPIGCLTHHRLFFADGKIDATRLSEAQTQVQAQIAPLRQAYQQCGWSQVIGSSGTARALAEILERNDLNPLDQHSTSQRIARITRIGLERLRSQLLQAGHLKNLNLQALDAERRLLIAGGLSIMLGILIELEIDSLDLVHDALRMGVIYELFNTHSAALKQTHLHHDSEPLKALRKTVA